MPVSRLVPTPIGDARLLEHPANDAVATLVLTHGAGGGIDARDLVVLADGLPGEGVAVTLVEMPWRVEGKRLAPRPAVIDVAFRAVLESVHATGALVIGGRSAGARSACRVGSEAGAAGVLALSFPLHPPGKPESSRLDELLGAGVPTLVVQGERDPFGGPAEFPDPRPAGVRLVGVPGADHGMKVPVRQTPTSPLRQDAALALIAATVLTWVGTEIAGNP
ncbi:MAG: hydrolase [Marmoricola sp.]|nr:hydrolase [Marmoricola sp.]